MVLRNSGGLTVLKVASSPVAFPVFFSQTTRNSEFRTQSPRVCVLFFIIPANKNISLSDEILYHIYENGLVILKPVFRY